MKEQLELVTEEDRDIFIVMSLQDKAYELIKSGLKNYEFRRRWRKGPCVAYIYRSGKCRTLSAVVRLGMPIYMSPKEAGRIAESMITGNGKSVEEYFMKDNGGYVIPIESFEEIKPLELNVLRQFGFYPPQFFSYLDVNSPLFKFIRKPI